MSLFPAYADGTATVQRPDLQPIPDWLYANSAGLPSTSTSQLSDKCSEGNENNEENKDIVKQLKKKKKKRKKDKARKEKAPIGFKIPEDVLFCVDKTSSKYHLKFKTLNPSQRPRYSMNWKNIVGFSNYNPQKIKKFKRYFIKRKKSHDDFFDLSDFSNLRKVEEYSKTLHSKSDVANWIAFVEFQDEYFDRQNVIFGSESEKKKIISDRKFLILEKALSFNPTNEKLIQLWVDVGSDVLLPEELMRSIEKKIEMYPGNTLLWLNLISVRQQCLSICSFTSVSALYKKAINAVKSAKRGNILDRDSAALEVLFHYCRFLDQCGQWEILWSIIKKTMQLNFDADIIGDVHIEDDRMKKIENELFSLPGQPIWVIWARLELVREGLHFLPVTESIDYPQRCVSTEDFIDFVLHYSRELHFRLIVIFIFLIKVPLLPFSNSVFKFLFKDALPWTLDSPEIVLSSAFCTPAANIKFPHLKHIIHVIRGPQYIKNLQGQLEFLDVIQKTFQDCMKLLEGNEKTALALWWFRFNRWLYILDKTSLASIQDNAKKTKTMFKEFMRNDDNRNNLLFYCEYSLFEYDQGNVESSIKTLKTLIASKQSVYDLNNELEKASLCQAYKYLCEIFIASGQTEEAVMLLMKMGAGCTLKSKSENLSLSQVFNKFESMAQELISQIDVISSLEQFMLPQFSIEWISCYMWLMALTKSITHVQTYVQKILANTIESKSNFYNYFREKISETTSLIYWAISKNNDLAVRHVIKDTLSQFPLNLTTLSILASKKLDDHGPWWLFKESFLHSRTIFASIHLICVALQRKEADEVGFINRIKSLFQQISAVDGRLSSVIHCLAIKFIFECDSPRIEAACIRAMESCPWNKSVYMGAIAALPNKLMEVTDIMIEKELRIHVTPDEIEALRD